MCTSTTDDEFTIVLLAALSCLPSNFAVLENFDVYLQQDTFTAADGWPAGGTWVALAVVAQPLGGGYRCSHLMVET